MDENQLQLKKIRNKHPISGDGADTGAGLWATPGKGRSSKQATPHRPGPHCVSTMKA